MTEQVLTDEEKSALLDGVSSGAVAIHGDGVTQYASVRPFEIGPRGRIVTDSYPRLQALDQQLAARLQKLLEGLLRRGLDVATTGIEVLPWSACLALPGRTYAAVITASPLSGNGILVLQAELIGHLVDAFFGGEVRGGHAADAGAFTAGEATVANRFCRLLLDALREVWQPLMTIAPEQAATGVDLDLVDVAGANDPVIASAFEVAFADHRGAFQLLWPRETLTPLLPALSGGKRERNPVGDARWEQSIRARLADVPVRIDGCVGDMRSTVGEVAALKAGDVIGIGSPRRATLRVDRAALLEGRFGLCEERNAIEATRWLTPADGISSKHKDQ